MAIVTFSTDVVWSGKGVLSEADVNGKKVLIDEPAHLGGTDIAPNPVEYLLVGLGGCINVLVATYAEEYNVKVDYLEVKVHGDLDPDGFLGKNKDVRPGFSEIRYECIIQSDSNNEDISALLSHVEKICPVKDTLIGTIVKRTAN